LKRNKKKYESLLFTNPFSLGTTTSSALKTLNKEKHLEVFNNDWEFFDNARLLPVYHLLFQITEIFDNNLKNLEKRLFIEKFKKYILENTQNIPLGNFSLI
jgi:vesicle coat complex subunit